MVKVRCFNRGISLLPMVMLADGDETCSLGQSRLGCNRKDVGGMMGRRGTDWSGPAPARMGNLAGDSDARRSRRTGGDAGTVEDLNSIGPEARRASGTIVEQAEHKLDKAGGEGQSSGNRHANAPSDQAQSRVKRADDGRRPRMNRRWRSLPWASWAGAFREGCRRRCFGFEVAIVRRN